MATTDFRGADERTRKELHHTLSALEDEWPGVAPSKVRVGVIEQDKDGTTMGETDSRTNEIVIARKFARDYDGWCNELHQACKLHRLREGIEDHPAEYTMVHEFGHVLASHVFGRLDEDDDSGDPAIRRLVVDAWKVAGVPEADDIPIEAVPLAWAMGFGVDAVEADLTPYANASPHELIAESFAIHRKFGPGTSKVADLVMGKIEAAYEAKYGKRAA